ncbi:hypothetical protein [Streptomyces sp. NBC_00690]|uniref:hypothetical protein n=1 Tax=Streptomyces sp. NBC_00690 TaxID=2975808 RepID=UPI002E2C58AD|nr:hypothetical protein [Streptomyces sp. NBC_00690]
MRRRSSAAASVLASAALLLTTGCSGDDRGDNTGPQRGKQPTPWTSADSNTTGGTELEGEQQGADDPDIARVEGAWTGTTGGKKVDLAITGRKAALVTEGRACTGEVADHRTSASASPLPTASSPTSPLPTSPLPTSPLTLTLKCVDGNTKRTIGRIESGDGATLVISWAAGPKDTLLRAAEQALPTG